jgi:hypothetical protein
MKKLIMLVSSIMMSLNCFSQTDTICLPSNILKLAAKDLIKYDACLEENLLLYDQIKIQSEILLLNDEIISIQKDQNKNLFFIISQKDEQIDIYKNINTKLQHDLTKQSNKTNLWKIITGTVSLTLLGVLLIN